MLVRGRACPKIPLILEPQTSKTLLLIVVSSAIIAEQRSPAETLTTLYFEARGTNAREFCCVMFDGKPSCPLLFEPLA